MIKKVAFHASLIIICPNHGKFSQRADKHLLGALSCEGCKKERRRAKFYESLPQRGWPDRYDYSNVEYISAEHRIRIRCIEHDINFDQLPGDHFAGKSGCSKCKTKNYKAAASERAFSNEKFFEVARQYHPQLDYSNAVYTDYNDPLCGVICPEHGEFTVLRACRHITERRTGCPDCGRLKNTSKRKLSYDEFKNRVIDVHGGEYEYDIDETQFDMGKKIRILCKEHGWFSQVAQKHSKGAGCTKCGFGRTSKQLVMPVNEFMRRAIHAHGDRFDYSLVPSSFKGSQSKVTIICREHGAFDQQASSHFRGLVGCRDCKSRELSSILRKTTEDYISEAREAHGNRYDYSKVDYVDAHSKVIIICRKHGDFLQSADSHVNARHGCSRCNGNVSKKETIWLDSLGIHGLERQYLIKIPKSKFRRRARVDGFDPATNTIYLFHGDFWHGNPRRYASDRVHPVRKTKTFGNLYDATLSYEAALIEAGYNVISLWEDEFDAKFGKNAYRYYASND